LFVELELKAERLQAEVRITDPSEYQAVVDAEWTIIYNKLDKLVSVGANIVLSRMPIGDLATQYFADRDIFCAGRVKEEDMERICKATGAVMQTSMEDLTPAVLGTCDTFEERGVGTERHNFILGAPKTKTATIILRGGSQQYLEETHRSLTDALNIVKRARQHSQVVGGGGAIQMELSRYLREHARTIKNKTQVIVSAYARALEVIPRQLAHNAGFDATDIVNELRARHAKKGGEWFGVDIENEGVCDTFKAYVWEPALVVSTSLSAACESACLILSIDETIRAPESQDPGDKPKKGKEGGIKFMPGMRATKE